MSFKAILRRRKKPIAVVSVVAAIIIGLVIWLITSNATWASLSGVLLALLPNGYSIFRMLVGLSRIIKLGWKEAEISLLEREGKINRLLQLDQDQDRNPEGYIKTDLESVSHKGLTTTAPHVLLRIKFYNLLVRKCKILGWKLRIERSDDCHINCKGKPCQLRPQGASVNIDIKPCTLRKFDIRLDMQESVFACIKEVAENRELVYYQMNIDWQIEIEGFGEISFTDYLSHSCIPNLAA